MVTHISLENSHLICYPHRVQADAVSTKEKFISNNLHVVFASAVADAVMFKVESLWRFIKLNPGLTQDQIDTKSQVSCSKDYFRSMTECGLIHYTLVEPPTGGKRLRAYYVSGERFIAARYEKWKAKDLPSVTPLVLVEKPAPSVKAPTNKPVLDKEGLDEFVDNLTITEAKMLYLKLQQVLSPELTAKPTF